MEVTNDFKIGKLMENYDNSKCVDCGIEFRYLYVYIGQANPTFVSVNNGVFVCHKCADVHRSVIASNISLIRSVALGSWNEKQIQYLEMGGNDKFSKFLDTYALMTEPANNKYKSKAAEYYRSQVNIQ